MRRLAGLALWSTACGTPAPHAPAATDAIDAIARAALDDGDAVGISLAVAHGELVETRTYGLADREHKLAMRPDAVFPLASLSKQYWAAAAVTQPGFDPDAPLAKVLPGFPERGIRVRDVFQQTSGLGDDHEGEDDTSFGDLPPLAFPPGTWWLYSNRGAIVARHVAEQLAGRRWPDYVRERLAPSLGLEATAVCGDHVQLYDHGHRTNGVSDETWRRVQFVCSTAGDVVRFERALDAPQFAALRAPVVIERLGELPYGMLTRIGDVAGHRAYGHTGNFDGVSVAAYRFPADDLTIVVLMNATPKPGFRADQLVERIARFELHVAEPAAAAPPPELVADIAGDYTTGEARGTFGVRGGRAWATVHVGEHVLFDGPLAWRGGRTFDAADGQHDVFLPATGKARAVAAGSALMFEALARRVEPP